MNPSKRFLSVMLASVVAAGSLGSAVAYADAVPAPLEEKIRGSLQVLLPNVEPDSIRTTPVPGLVEVVFGPRLVYMTEDGRYLLQGSVIDLEARENLTEARLAEAKSKAIEAIGEGNMVIFGPETADHTITVFTDIDCGYCRKLHAEMGKYNDAGIRVRYLYYPRAGIDSDSYKKAVATWCADDRNEAMTAAKQGDAIDMKQCENPVAAHYELGNLMGVQGTPAIVLEGGEMVPGYVPPDRLKQALDQRRVAAKLQ